MEVVDTLPVGQEGQALVYVANAVPWPANGTESLGTQGLEKNVTGSPGGTALFTIRQIEGVDMLQIAGRSLEINQTLDLWKVEE
ncbi:hypothetical protein M7I_0976 [Glarea lozoyensis 74030]|uniref:Uncharacterized protein n=1 Tax=Glarea lozoyensis (strain ATCC 74030 / MF5533) TaxID=1104152 RepID=H0EEU2_GLAL7|nr:hypothetical protein M7I_0976 [Glarea lozoyensis 74030]